MRPCAGPLITLPGWHGSHVIRDRATHRASPSSGWGTYLPTQITRRAPPVNARSHRHDRAQAGKIRLRAVAHGRRQIRAPLEGYSHQGRCRAVVERYAKTEVTTLAGRRVVG